MKHPTLTMFQNEQWLIRRLFDITKERADSGDTTPEQRKDRVREIILKHNVSMLIVGRGANKPVTFEEAFERLYREPMQVKANAA